MLQVDLLYHSILGRRARVQSDDHHVQTNLPAAKTTTHIMRNRNIETAKLACFLNSLRPSLIRVVRRKNIERTKRKIGIAAAMKAMILKIIVHSQCRVTRSFALAVTTATRSEALPDIPTMAEFLPDYEASAWFGIGAPKNTPYEIIDKLNKEINAGLADPKLKAQLADLGGTPLTGSPSDFGKLIAEETEKWGKVIRAANIKPE